MFSLSLSARKVSNDLLGFLPLNQQSNGNQVLINDSPSNRGPISPAIIEAVKQIAMRKISGTGEDKMLLSKNGERMGKVPQKREIAMSSFEGFPFAQETRIFMP